MNDNGKFLLGLLTGLGLGTAMGILLAPEEGSKTLKKLEKAVKSATSDLQQFGSEKLKEAKKASK
ncbi:hypothetical protein E1176_07070 [Fulvivirga sp. RKSG066]|uniref:YtxH domain-containing protein n=1 Tax=Fulvivirga aurantia TaxID=2529383 RepID=UPI0012BB491F|nr:YtxH domain-containing protein [Fulvivirga aurantia]MTI20775.1 hypothetical protein [Fulvivirga aurantia]